MSCTRHAPTCGGAPVSEGLCVPVSVACTAVNDGECRYWSGVSPTLQPHDAVPTVAQPTPGIVEVDPSILWNPQTLIGATELTAVQCFRHLCLQRPLSQQT